MINKNPISNKPITTDMLSLEIQITQKDEKKM